MGVDDKVCADERRSTCLDVLEEVSKSISENAVGEGYKRVVLSARMCCLDYVKTQVNIGLRSYDIPVVIFSSNGSSESGSNGFELNPGDGVYYVESLCEQYRREHSLRIR